MISQSALCNIIAHDSLSQTSLLKEILYLQSAFFFWKTAGLTPYLFFKKPKGMRFHYSPDMLLDV
ncbi:hypothetical protein BTW01_15880 [Bacillus sp. SKDU12]|nr:hypothetical protein BTW01_15880 [Bacillus sp. SKDU12]